MYNKQPKSETKTEAKQAKLTLSEQRFALEQKLLQLLQQPEGYDEAKKLLDTIEQTKPQFKETDNFKGMQLAYQAYGIQHGLLKTEEYKDKKSAAVKESITIYTAAIQQHNSLSAAYLCGLLYWDEYLLSHNKEEMYAKAIDCFTRATELNHRESMVKLSEIQLAHDASVKKPVAFFPYKYNEVFSAETRAPIERLFQAIRLGSTQAFDVLFQQVHPTILSSIPYQFNPATAAMKDHFYYGTLQFKSYEEVVRKAAEKNIPRAIYSYALSGHKIPKDKRPLSWMLNDISLLCNTVQVNDLAIATAAIACLETYLKDKEVGSDASYKLFTLHHLGLGPIKQDEKKALSYWRQNILKNLPKAGILQLLANDLEKRVEHLQQLKEQKQPMTYAVQRAWTLNVFAQTQDWSKEPAEIQSKIHQANETLINMQRAQTEAENHNKEEIASANTTAQNQNSSHTNTDQVIIVFEDTINKVLKLSSKIQEQLFALEQTMIAQLKLVKQPEEYQTLQKLWSADNKTLSVFSQQDRFKSMQLILQAFGIQHGFLKSEDKDQQSATDTAIQIYTQAFKQYNSVNAIHLCGLLCWSEYQAHPTKDMYEKAISYFSSAAEQNHLPSLTKLDEIGIKVSEGQIKKNNEAKKAIDLTATIGKKEKASPFDVSLDQNIDRLLDSIFNRDFEAEEILFQEVHPSILALKHTKNEAWETLFQEVHPSILAWKYADQYHDETIGKTTYGSMIGKVRSQMKKCPMEVYCSALANYYSEEILRHHSSADRYERYKTIHALYQGIQLNNHPWIADGIKYLETYLKDKQTESYASYKLFVLHYFGLGPVKHDREKALSYWRQNFVSHTPKAELLELLAHDLTERVALFKQLSAQEQLAHNTAWQQILDLHLFAQKQDWSKESLSIQNEIYAVNKIIIGMRFAQNEIEFAEIQIHQPQRNTSTLTTTPTSTTTTTTTSTATASTTIALPTTLSLLEGYKPSVVSTPRTQHTTTNRTATTLTSVATTATSVAANPTATDPAPIQQNQTNTM